MPILILLQLLFALTLALLILIGPMLMLSGKTTENKKRLRLGFRLFLIPFIIIGSVVIFKFTTRKLAEHLTMAQLAGHYRLTTADESESAVLRLHENGKFENLNFGAYQFEKGKFSKYGDEIWFRCDNHTSIAKIKYGLTGYKLEFKLYRESWYFEKTGD